MSDINCHKLAFVYQEAKEAAQRAAGEFDDVCRTGESEERKERAWEDYLAAKYFRDGVQTAAEVLGIWPDIVLAKVKV